jgi:hypothetical protein
MHTTKNTRCQVVLLFKDVPLGSVTVSIGFNKWSAGELIILTRQPCWLPELYNNVNLFSRFRSGQTYSLFQFFLMSCLVVSIVL